MKYCILIEITRDTISFYYNKDDGESRFIPYGDERVKPLSVICDGDELSMGSYAHSEAMHGNPNAYTDMFDVIQLHKVIKYRGCDYDINKLLFLAIERYISEFFDRVLLRQEGSLEDNRASLPLILMFGNDLKENERSFVRESFKNGGYGCIREIDGNSLLMTIVDATAVEGCKACLFVGGSKDDLHCHLVVGGDKKTEFRLAGVGSDPRIAAAAKNIWRAIEFEGYYVVGDKKMDDEQKVRDEAADFIRSGLSERDSAIMLSDGRTYPYFLQTTGINMHDNTLDDNCQRAFLTIGGNLSSEGIDENSCVVVLADKDVANDYIKSLFRNKFSNVIKVSDKDREEVRNRILAEVKANGYIFVKEPAGPVIAVPPPKPPVKKDDDAEAFRLFKDGRFKEARDMFRTLKGDYGKDIKECTECIRDKREFNYADEDTRNDIIKRWKQYGINRSVIGDLLGDERPPIRRQYVPNKRDAEKKTVADKRKDVSALAQQRSSAPAPSFTITPRDFRQLTAEYSALIRTGKKSEGERKFIALANKLHRADIHEFDEKLKQKFKEHDIQAKI